MTKPNPWQTSAGLDPQWQQEPDVIADPVSDKTVAEIFGEIVWLMTQDPKCRDMRLRELEHIVMPAIMLKQFHITYLPVPTRPSANGTPLPTALDGPGRTTLQPIKAEIYALVSDEVAHKLNEKAGLALADWRSGDQRKVLLAVSVGG